MIKKLSQKRTFVVSGTGFSVSGRCSNNIKAVKGKLNLMDLFVGIYYLLITALQWYEDDVVSSP